MSEVKLDAIRARDAAGTELVDTFGYWQLIGDRRALLAHVDEQAKRIERLEVAAQQLFSLVENKGQPISHPDNQALINAGDTISVNEGNLWNLKLVLHILMCGETKP